MLDLVDLVLVMTVNPGFGGQRYLATMEPKIAEVRRMVEAAGLADVVDVEVDGGIAPDTVAGAAAAGANVLVAGSALYRDPDGPRARRHRAPPPRHRRHIGFLTLLAPGERERDSEEPGRRCRGRWR